jgi:hypothetical protein
MGDYHIKRIVLPSGKTVEIVYYKAAGGEPIITEAREVELEPETPEQPKLRQIELCVACGGERVQPLDWLEVENLRWELALRCPDCEWEQTETFNQAEVERYDDVLNDATDRMIEALDRVTRQNMSEAIERFRLALENDDIVPFDF